jgi:hypothetical protein
MTSRDDKCISTPTVQINTNMARCPFHTDSKETLGPNNVSQWINCTNTSITFLNNDTKATEYYENINLGKPVLMLMAIGIALMGNFFTIFSYCKNFKMRTITNTLVVNLCAADLLSSIFDLPFWLSVLVGSPIYRQLLLCRGLFCFEDLFHIVAILTMCGIAVDRYFTLVKGLRRLMTHHRARVLILWSWIQAIISAAPWNLIHNLHGSRCRTFPHLYDPAIQIEVFNIFLKIINIVLPFLVSYYVFYRIVQAVRGRTKVNIDNNYVSRNYSAERFAVDAYKRSSKTAIILFFMFFICSIPYLCATLWSLVSSDKVGIGIGFIIYFIFTLKRSLFPAIYIFRNRVIWNYIQETLTCTFCRATDNAIQQDSLSYVPADQTTACFTVFGRKFYRSRIHPSVFDGENNYFPKNLEVCFVCNGKEVNAMTDRFTDITKEGDKKFVACSSSGQ